ncbi:hypothetical protein D3C87_1819980 [compost metagenome]
MPELCFCGIIADHMRTFRIEINGVAFIELSVRFAANPNRILRQRIHIARFVGLRQHCPAISINTDTIRLDRTNVDTHFGKQIRIHPVNARLGYSQFEPLPFRQYRFLCIGNIGNQHRNTA